ncbi:MAG: hypothetical protein ACKVS7_16355 [Gemmatimonadaceae bacterium]
MLARARTLALAATLLALPTLASAQSHPLVGKWSVDLVAGQRIENGQATQITTKGTLEVVLQGDSLIGTLVTVPTEGMPQRPPSRLAGKRVDGTMTFVSRSEGTINANGEMQSFQAISTWSLRASGDTLEGSVSRELLGVSIPDMGAQPVKGTRVK